jgi:hypothetical protein
MTKKQFRQDVEAKLDTAFGHLAKAADKKFRKVLKKASQLLTDVLHKSEPKPKKVKTKQIATKTDSKVETKTTKPTPIKKAPAKAIKKAAVKKAVIKKK